MFVSGATSEELMEALAQDEKAYTADEINEIREAISSYIPEEGNAAIAPAPKGKKAVGFEEWRCEIKLKGDGKKEVEKVKRLRASVKITDEEAETLNRGAKDSPRQDFVIMYFKPE